MTYKKMPIRPTKNAHPTYEKFPSDSYEKCPSTYMKMPIRTTKNAHLRPPKSAHPTYEKCPSDLRKVSIRPITKSAHLTYEIE